LKYGTTPSAAGVAATKASCIEHLGGGVGKDVLTAAAPDAAWLWLPSSQASAEEEYVEVEDDSGSNGSSSGSHGSNGGKPPTDSSKSGRKWWQVGSLTKSKSKSSSKPAARAVADEAAEAQRRQRQERVHQLVAAALDVLLRLTPLPQGYDSCFKNLSRPDVSPLRSLAMPLMVHCDTVPALSGCLWSSWTDVQTKAVSVAGMLGRVWLAAQSITALACQSGWN
jgi:hypothetical protein